MRKFFAVCVSLILFSLFLFPHDNAYSGQSNEAHPPYAADRIIVKLRTDVEPDFGLDQMAGEIVGAPARGEARASQRRGGINLIHLDGGVSVEEAILRAQQDARVEYAEPDYFVYAMDTVPNDPFFSQMWGLSNVGSQTSNIEAPHAWDITTGSDDVVVAVLDTGADLQHEDLVSNAWVNPSPGALGAPFINDINGWKFYDGNNQIFKSFNEDSHGTHVSGTIGATGNNAKG